MAFDPGQGVAVLFGGTLELAHDCVHVADGHPGGDEPISCIQAPVIGQRFTLAFRSIQGAGLLFIGKTSPTPIFRALPPLVCTAGELHVLPVATVPLAGNPARFSVMIPNNTAFLGHRIGFQGAASQASSCQLLTDAVEVTVR